MHYEVDTMIIIRQVMNTYFKCVAVNIKNGINFLQVVQSLKLF